MALFLHCPFILVMGQCACTSLIFTSFNAVPSFVCTDPTQEFGMCTRSVQFCCQKWAAKSSWTYYSILVIWWSQLQDCIDYLPRFLAVPAACCRCMQLIEIMFILYQYENNEVVTNFIRQKLSVMRQKTSVFDLSAILIKPVQRILKYPLLLSELLKVLGANQFFSSVTVTIVCRLNFGN